MVRSRIYATMVVLRPGQAVNVLELFPEERAELLALLRGLTAEQWASPTVSPGWSVADIARHLATLDLDAIGSPVMWAGPDPAPVWLDLAREYTERWHHQQQIRDAVGAVDLMTPRLFAPVLATFVFALPHTFRNTLAADGSTVHLRISGESGGDWSLQREDGSWHLYTSAPERPTSRVTLPEYIAWRLFTRGVHPAQAEPHAMIEGDFQLGRQVLETVSVIA